MPILGQGTWRMGESKSHREQEVAALKLGLDLGLTLIDTAEMYGDGGAEEVVAEAIAGRRKEVFLVSKVYPHNGTRDGVAKACERSLRRLKTDYLDVYLLHWRGSVPLEETFEGFMALKKAGKIRSYGVSNFDVSDMEEAQGVTGGDAIVTNQVMYNLAHRGIECDLAAWCRERSIPIMAYSPVEHGRAEQKGMLGNVVLTAVAARHEATPAQVALAWLLRRGTVAIPKASNPKHIRENRGALDINLTPEDLAALDNGFPQPARKLSLEMR